MRHTGSVGLGSGTVKGHKDFPRGGPAAPRAGVWEEEPARRSARATRGRASEKERPRDGAHGAPWTGKWVARPLRGRVCEKKSPRAGV